MPKLSKQTNDTAIGLLAVVLGGALVVPLFLASRKQANISIALSKLSAGEPLTPEERDLVQEHLGRPV